MKRRVRRRAEKNEGTRFRLKAGNLAGLLVLEPVWGRSAQWKEDKCRHQPRPQCRKFPMQTLRWCDGVRPTSGQSGYRDDRWRRASRWKARDARSPFAAISSLSSPRGSPQSDLFSSPPLLPTSTAAVSPPSPPLSQPTVSAFPHPDRLYSPCFSCSPASSQSASHSPLSSAALSPFSRCSLPTFCSSPSVKGCASPPCCSPPSPWTPSSSFFPAASALVHARRWNLRKEENRFSRPASRQGRIFRLRSSLRCLHWPILFLSVLLLVCTYLSPSLMTSNLPYRKHAHSFFVVIFSHAVSHSHGGISLSSVSADLGDEDVLETVPQDWELAESSDLRLSPSHRPSPFRRNVSSRSSSSQKYGRSATSRQRAALPVSSVPFLFSQYGMASRVVSPLRLETQATKPSASSPDSQEKNWGGKSSSEHDFVVAFSPHTAVRPADSRNSSSSGRDLLSMKVRHRQERQRGRGRSSPPRPAPSPRGAAPSSEGYFPSFTERKSSLGDEQRRELLKLSADDSAFEEKTLKLRKGVVRRWPMAEPSFSGSLSTLAFSPSRKHGPFLHGSTELAEENSTREEDRTEWIPIASSQGDGESEGGPAPEPEGVEEETPGGASGGSHREDEVTGRGEPWSGRSEGVNNTGEWMHRQKPEKGRLRRRDILRETAAENELMAGAKMLGGIDSGVEESLWMGAYPGSFLGIRSSDNDDGDDGDDDGDEEEEEEEESKHKHHPKHHEHKHDSEEEETEEDEEKEHKKHKASESSHSHRDQRYAHTGASVAHILQGNDDDGMREIAEEEREYDEERMEEKRERDEERREDRRERDAERREDKEETDEEISEEQEERGARKGRRSETHAPHSATSSLSTEEDLSTVLTVMSPAFVPGTGSHANTAHHEESLAEKKHKKNGAENAAGPATQIPAQTGQAAVAGNPGVAGAAPGTPMMLQQVSGAQSLVAGGISTGIPAAAFPQATMVAGANALPQGTAAAAPAVPPTAPPAAPGTPAAAASGAAPGTPPAGAPASGAPSGTPPAGAPASGAPSGTPPAGAPASGAPPGTPPAAAAASGAPPGTPPAGAPASGAPPGTPPAAAASGTPAGTPPAAAASGAPPATPPAGAPASGAPPATPPAGAPASGTPPGTPPAAAAASGTPPGTPPAAALGAAPGAPVATPGTAPVTATPAAAASAPPGAAGTPGVVAGGPGLVPAVVAPAAGVAPLVAAAPGMVAGAPPTAVVVPTTAEQAAVAAEVAREQLVAATLAAEGLAPGAGVPPPPPRGRGWKAWSLGLLAFAIVVAFSCCGGCGYVFNNKLTRSLRRMRRKYKDALARRRLSEMEKQRAKKHGEKSGEDSGEDKGGEGKNHRHKDSKSSDEKGDGKRQAKAALKLRGNPPTASDKKAEKG